MPLKFSIRVPQFLKEKECWLLVALSLLHFYRILFFNESLYFRDLYLYYIPHKQLLTDFFKVGAWPLWDPYLHGGQPYLAALNPVALYPTNILYWFFPLLKAFNLEVVLHHVICLVGMYAFARTLRLSPVSSAIAAIIYGCCGYMFSLIDVGRFLAMSFLPVIFGAWHRYLLERRKRWFVLAVLAGTIQIFSGAPEGTLASIFLLAVWTWCYPYSGITRRTKLTMSGAALSFIVGMALIQVLPTVEMIGHSNRGVGINYLAAITWSLAPGRFPELIFPNFSGYLDTLQPQLYYWGGRTMPEATPYIISIYWGAVPLLLALVGGGQTNTHQGFPGQVRRGLLGVALLSFALAVGRFLPFFKLLYDYLPGIQFFRFPIKFMLAGMLPIALLAGYAVELHFVTTPPTRGEARAQHFFGTWNLSGIAWTILIVGAAGTILFFGVQPVAGYVLHFFFKLSPADTIPYQELKRALLQSMGVWIVFTLLLQYRRIRPTSWQAWMLAVTLAIDLLLAGSRLNPSVSASFFYDIPEIVPIVQRKIGSGRLFSHQTNAMHLSLQAPSNEVFWLYRWNLETLNDYASAFYRIPAIFHNDFDLLAGRYIKDLGEIILQLQWNQRLPLLSAAAVTTIVTPDRLDAVNVRYVADIPNRSNLKLYVYRNENAANRVEVITHAEWVTTDAMALHHMLRPGFDPRKQVVLSSPNDPPVHTTLSASAAVSHDCEAGSLTTLQTRILSQSFSTSTECDGFVVFAEPYYPGWQIQIDGKTVPLFRANYAFSAARLPAGEHRIERRYRPMSVTLGAMGSLLSASGLLIFWGWPRRAKRT